MRHLMPSCFLGSYAGLNPACFLGSYPGWLPGPYSHYRYYSSYPPAIFVHYQANLIRR